MAAFATNTEPAPTNSSSPAPVSGPMAREAVNCAELSLMADSRLEAGTSSGTKASQLEAWMPTATPITRFRPRIRHGVSPPVIHRAAKAAQASALTARVMTMTRRREKRSARTPDTGARPAAGISEVKAAAPTQVLEAVISYMMNGTVNCCIQLAAFEMSAADQNRAKSRCRSAPSAPGRPRCDAFTDRRAYGWGRRGTPEPSGGPPARRGGRGAPAATDGATGDARRTCRGRRVNSRA